MASMTEFLKKNTQSSVGKTMADNKLGKGIIAFDIANLITGEHKLKSIWAIFRDLVLLRPVLALGFASLFLGMSKAIRSIVHDTGSLEASLKKMSQIQGLQKMFTGIMGGAAAAKLKVAELVNFAATRNIKLGDAAEASRSLMLMTRNAFSSARALDVVNDAAKATGNTVVGLADAVGEFSTALREGASIGPATDALRQMGVISDATAESFLRLQKNGATTGQIFGSLTTSLEQFKGGANQAKESIEGVNEAFEDAQTNLQEKFGSPFVEDDVKNTKNYTAAMNSMAPAVARVGKFFNVLTGGFSTTKSMIVETAASWMIVRKSLEGLVYVLGSAVALFGVLGASSLAGFFRNLSTSIAASTAEVTTQSILASKGMNVFGQSLSIAGVSGKATEGILVKTSGAMAKMTKVLPALSRALAYVPVIGIGVAIGGAVKKWLNSFEEAAIALQDMQKGQNQANQVVANQIKNIRTLADMHDAVTAALKRETEARSELAAAVEKGNKKEIEAAETSLTRASTNAQKSLSFDRDKLGPTPEETAATLRDIARSKEQEEAKFQARLNLANPSERIGLSKSHTDEKFARAKRGEESEKATAKFSRNRMGADLDVLSAQRDLDNAKTEMERLRRIPATLNLEELNRITLAIQYQELAIEKATAALKLFKTQQAEVGKTAAAGTTTKIRADIRSNESREISPTFSKEDRIRKAAQLELELAQALIEEKEAGENRLAATQERNDQAAAKREIALNKIAMERSLDIQTALAPNGSGSGVRDDNDRYGSPFAATPSVKDQEQTFEQRAAVGSRWNTSGSKKSAEGIKDLEVFADKYQEMINAGYDAPEAKSKASKFADQAVSISGDQTELGMANAIVGDSLTKIGGGGGVYTPGGGDPMVSIGQRTNNLHEAELELLRQIAAANQVGVL